MSRQFLSRSSKIDSFPFGVTIIISTGVDKDPNFGAYEKTFGSNRFFLARSAKAKAREQIKVVPREFSPLSIR